MLTRSQVDSFPPQVETNRVVFPPSSPDSQNSSNFLIFSGERNRRPVRAIFLMERRTSLCRRRSSLAVLATSFETIRTEFCCLCSGADSRTARWPCERYSFLLFLSSPCLETKLSVALPRSKSNADADGACRRLARMRPTMPATGFVPIRGLPGTARRDRRPARTGRYRNAAR